MSEPAAIRVLTVDDHPLLREGIAAVLMTSGAMVVVGEAANGLEAVEQHRLLAPDVTLMDLQMPVMGGLEAIQAIRQVSPDARIIVLTTYDGDVLARRAIQAGATAYLLKSSLRKELVETIRLVHAGRRRIPSDVASTVAEHLADETLTAREVEVLRLIASGGSNRRIAEALSITEETVKTHVKHVMGKLAANDRTHAVTIAMRRGILLP